MIRCRICGAMKNRVSGAHLYRVHKMTTREYQEKFPSAPIMSKSEYKWLAEQNEHQRSAEARQRSSKLRSDWWRNNPEQREVARRRARRQIADNPQIRENLTKGTKAARARWGDPEFRVPRLAEMSAEQHRRWDSMTEQRRQETVDALHRGLLESWSHADRKRAASELMRRLLQDPQFIKARNRASKETWNDAEYRRRMKPILLRNLKRVRSKWTKPERVVRDWLKRLGLYHKVGGQFRPHQWIGSYNCDFVDRVNKLVIEVDGNYWHGPDRPKTQERDRKKNAYLVRQGWTLLRLWESEVREKPRTCRRRIQQLCPTEPALTR